MSIRIDGKDKVMFGDVEFERTQEFSDELTAYTDNGNYAIVVMRDEYEDEWAFKSDCYNIQVFEIGDEIELYQQSTFIPDYMLKQMVVNIYKDFNNR